MTVAFSSICFTKNIIWPCPAITGPAITDSRGYDLDFACGRCVMYDCVLTV